MHDKWCLNKNVGQTEIGSELGFVTKELNSALNNWPLVLLTLDYPIRRTLSDEISFASSLLIFSSAVTKLRRILSDFTKNSSFCSRMFKNAKKYTKIFKLMLSTWTLPRRSIPSITQFCFKS